MLNTLYHHDTVKIQYEKEKSILILSWFDDAIDNVFMEVVERMYHFTKELEVELWLIDASHAFGVKTWDPEWKCEKVTMALQQTNLQKVARIMSHDIAYEAKINSFSESCKMDIKKQFFTEEETACNWLFKAKEKQSK